MLNHWITAENVEDYRQYLIEKEDAPATITKYMRDLMRFQTWLEGRAVTKEVTMAWKQDLQDNGLKPATVNAKIAAINGFLIFVGWLECKVKTLDNPQSNYCGEDQELTVEEFMRLRDTAFKLNKKRLAFLIETVCSTGIRVSELEYITVEACRSGAAQITMKGKIRTILLTGKLRRKLLVYADKQGIKKGCVFRTSSGKPLSRQQIWSELKSLCQEAQVDPRKVFPHNLRHLFARVYYKTNKNIVMLSNILGHSSIETTRIYLKTTAAECVRSMECLGLVS